jgi:hypothetical protein
MRCFSGNGGGWVCWFWIFFSFVLVVVEKLRTFVEMVGGVGFFYGGE